MYNINDRIVYGTNGVCNITDITEMDISGTKAQYYILSPVFDSHSKLFVPLSNEKLISTIRPLISEDEAKEILNSKPEEMDWIDNENERKDRFAEIMASGDRKLISRMIFCIYKHQAALKQLGKKLYVIDERTLKAAEHLLYEELSVVLDIPYPQIFSSLAPEPEF